MEALQAPPPEMLSAMRSLFATVGSILAATAATAAFAAQPENWETRFQPANTPIATMA